MGRVPGVTVTGRIRVTNYRTGDGYGFESAVSKGKVKGSGQMESRVLARSTLWVSTGSVQEFCIWSLFCLRVQWFMHISVCMVNTDTADPSPTQLTG